MQDKGKKMCLKDGNDLVEIHEGEASTKPTQETPVTMGRGRMATLRLNPTGPPSREKGRRILRWISPLLRSNSR